MSGSPNVMLECGSDLFFPRINHSAGTAART